MAFENMSMSEVLAYIAGLYDGEGCFMILRRKSRFNTRTQLKNCDRSMVDDVMEFWKSLGVVCNIYASDDPNGMNKTGYALVAAKRSSVIRMCMLLLPYLRSKKEQARLLLAFDRLRLDEGHHGCKYNEERALIVARVSYLNRRGV